MSTELSAETLDRLTEELESLRVTGRVEIAKKIEEARALGDLSENGDYHAAKDEQGKMEARIRDLEALLKNAKVLEPVAHDGLVHIGSRVTVSFDGDAPEVFLLGNLEEKEHAEVDVMSPDSPLGQQLLGRKVGDAATTPTGMKVTILAID